MSLALDGGKSEEVGSDAGFRKADEANGHAVGAPATIAAAAEEESPVGWALLVAVTSASTSS